MDAVLVGAVAFVIAVVSVGSQRSGRVLREGATTLAKGVLVAVRNQRINKRAIGGGSTRGSQRARGCRLKGKNASDGISSGLTGHGRPLWCAKREEALKRCSPFLYSFSGVASANGRPRAGITICRNGGWVVLGLNNANIANGNA